MKPHLPEIIVTENGPYRIEGIERLEHMGGEQLPVRRVMLLCRCSASQTKPFCDGSHTAIGFTPQKRRGPARYRAKRYAGKRVAIHFSLRTCSHAGLCLSKLPGVFDLSRQPWIDPDGASVDEVVAAINRCPSGALSCSISGTPVENPARPAKIIIIKDGPFNVQGNIRLHHGEEASPYNPDHYCLCRCGKTHNSPFCDGSHLPREARLFAIED